MGNYVNNLISRIKTIKGLVFFTLSLTGNRLGVESAPAVVFLKDPGLKPVVNCGFQILWNRIRSQVSLLFLHNVISVKLIPA